MEQVLHEKGELRISATDTVDGKCMWCGECEENYPHLRLEHTNRPEADLVLYCCLGCSYELLHRDMFVDEDDMVHGRMWAGVVHARCIEDKRSAALNCAACGSLIQQEVVEFSKVSLKMMLHGECWAETSAATLDALDAFTEENAASILPELL